MFRLNLLILGFIFLGLAFILSLQIGCGPLNTCHPYAVTVYESLPKTLWKKVLIYDANGEYHSIVVYEFMGKINAWDNRGRVELTGIEKSSSPVSVAKAFVVTLGQNPNRTKTAWWDN